MHTVRFIPKELITMIKARLERYLQRRGWDSNPRALADKRFSRPPRYDHFDTSPCSHCTSLPVSARIILAKMIFSVNLFFTFYSINFQRRNEMFISA